MKLPEEASVRRSGEAEGSTTEEAVIHHFQSRPCKLHSRPGKRDIPARNAVCPEFVCAGIGFEALSRRG